MMGDDNTGTAAKPRCAPPRPIADDRPADFYCDLLDNAADLIHSVSPEGRLLYVNRRWQDVLGYHAEEVLHRSIFDLLDPSCRQRCMRLFERLLAGEEIPAFECTFLTRDGRRVDLEGSVSVRFQGDRPVSSRGIFRPIGRRRRSRELLLQGIRLQGALARLGRLALSAEDQQALGDEAVTLLADTLDLPRAGVTRLLAEVGALPEPGGKGGGPGGAGAAEPLSSLERTFLSTAASILAAAAERRRMETALRDREAYLASVLNTAADAIVAIEESGEILTFNPAAEAMFGYRAEEVLGRNVSLLMPHGDREDHDARLRNYPGNGRPRLVGQQRQLLAQRKDGSQFPIELVVSRMHQGSRQMYTGVIRDLTERLFLEEQLRQAQKMEAVGRLAGGVAHDFNNMLAVINGYASLLQPRAHDPILSNGLSEIARAGERAATLTRQLLAFSRKQVLAPRLLDLTVVVGDMEKMLRRLIGEDIRLTVQCEPAPGQVRADPGQVEQCLLNLVVNARDAMPRGGTITVAVRRAQVAGDRPRKAGLPDPGDYVELSVSDTGTGIPPEVAEQIFEPFFTTKEAGKGTGLGLATVYGIMKQSGGDVTLESEAGRGATFRLYFPRIPEAPAEALPARPAAAPKGSETILLVEDEEMVRHLVRSVLQAQGYTVLEAADGAAAVRLAESHDGPIQLVVTDVVMPGGMGGRDVAEAVSHLHPEARVLFISGYTDDATVRHRVWQDETHFLQKPFGPGDLARKVREVLSPGS